MDPTQTTEPYRCPVCGGVSHHPKDIEHGYCHDCHAFTREPILTQWVIYESPLDAPGKWVMREWFLYNGMTEPVAGTAVLAPSLDGARMFVRPGAVRLEPTPEDDPVIKEVWV